MARGELSIDGADPLVLDDTANTGYYYAYVTGFSYYYSENLEDWIPGGGFMSLPADLNGSSAHWAPEVIYDEAEEKYYAFLYDYTARGQKYGRRPGPVYLSMVGDER